MHPLDCWLFLFFCRAAVHLICVCDGHWIWSSVPKLLPFNFIVIFGEWRKLQEANLMRGSYDEWKLLCCLAKKTQSVLSWHSGMQHGQKMTGSDLKIPAVLEAQSCLLIHEMARFKWAKFAVFMDLFSELLFFFSYLTGSHLALSSWSNLYVFKHKTSSFQSRLANNNKLLCCINYSPRAGRQSLERGAVS